MSDITIVKDEFKIPLRPSWDNYYMDLAKSLARRSTCSRAHVGAVIVNNDNRVVSTGYNGSAGNKSPHCDNYGHVMRDGHCIATVHAEINCISYCARKGVSIEGCSIYVTHFPCLNCAKALIQSGIKRVYFNNKYRVDEYAVTLFNVNNVEMIHVD